MKDERYELLKRSLNKPRIRLSDRTIARAQHFFLQYCFDPNDSFGRKMTDRVKKLNQQFPEIADEPDIRNIYYAGVVGYPWHKIPESGKCPTCEGSGKIDNKTCPNCGGIGQKAIAERGQILPEKAKEYSEKLLEDIPKCLYPENNQWFIEKLHERVIFANVGTPIFLTSEYDGPITHLDIPVYPQTRKEDLYKWVDQALETIKENPQYRVRLQQTSDEELQRYIKWLCRRLFHSHTAERILKLFPQDARDSRGNNYIVADVTRRTREVAKLLGIRLPRGRPAKAKKRRV